MKNKKEKSSDEKIDTDVKVTDISHTFGMLPGPRKMSGQKFKDLARKGWD